MHNESLHSTNMPGVGVVLFEIGFIKVDNSSANIFVLWMEDWNMHAKSTMENWEVLFLPNCHISKPISLMTKPILGMLILEFISSSWSHHYSKHSQQNSKNVWNVGHYRLLTHAVRKVLRDILSSYHHHHHLAISMYASFHYWNIFSGLALLSHST